MLLSPQEEARLRTAEIGVQCIFSAALPGVWHAKRASFCMMELTKRCPSAACPQSVVPGGCHSSWHCEAAANICQILGAASIGASLEASLWASNSPRRIRPLSQARVV